MATSHLSPSKVVSDEEWAAARKAFFLKEKAMTHELDALRAERRRLPWRQSREAVRVRRT